MCAYCALQVQSVIHPVCQVCIFTPKIQILNVFKKKINVWICDGCDLLCREAICKLLSVVIK